MSRLSGWCIDEVQAVDRDQPALAVVLCAACLYPECTCSNHKEEA